MKRRFEILHYLPLTLSLLEKVFIASSISVTCQEYLTGLDELVLDELRLTFLFLKTTPLVKDSDDFLTNCRNNACTVIQWNL